MEPSVAKKIIIFLIPCKEINTLNLSKDIDSDITSFISLKSYFIWPQEPSILELKSDTIWGQIHSLWICTIYVFIRQSIHSS